MDIALALGFALSLIGFLYPFLFYPLILRILPSASRIDRQEESVPDMSVALLFCAYNEERSLPTKLANLRELKKALPNLQIHAYTDCCTDGTVELLRKCDDIVVLHEGITRTGKAAGMKRMVAAIDVDVVVFTDANVILSPDAIPNLLRYFADDTIGTVAGTLFYTNHETNVVAYTGALYWRLEEYIKRLESRTGSTMGADGSIFAVRRILYPHIREDLLDDMVASMSPIFSGYRVISADDVRAFEKSTTSSEDEFGRKIRIGCRAYNTHKYLRRDLKQMGILNRFKYFSHKFLRWFSIAFFAVSVVLGTLLIAKQFGWITALGLDFLGMGTLIIGKSYRAPILAPIAEILLAILATGIGVSQAMLGRNYTTWNPAKSRE